MPKQMLTIKDYDGDEVRFDASSDVRFYVDTRCSEEDELGSGCVSMDRPAARAIIKLLEQWLGAEETHGISPNTITLEDF